MAYEVSGIQQGWQCPICKRVYSPLTMMCFYCGGECKTTITTASEIPCCEKETEKMTNEELQEMIRKNVAEHTVLSPAHYQDYQERKDRFNIGGTGRGEKV